MCTTKVGLAGVNFFKKSILSLLWSRSVNTITSNLERIENPPPGTHNVGNQVLEVSTGNGLWEKH